MYGEDLDWFFRMRKAGYKIYYVPSTKIIHYKGESTRAAGYDAIGMFYKAQIQFVRKHFSKSKSVFAVMFLYFGIVVRGLFSYAVKTGVSLAPPLMDTLMMQLSMLLAIRIKFGSFEQIQAYSLIEGIYTAVWLFSLYILGNYKRRRFSATYAAWAVILGFLVNTTFTFFFKQFAYSREVLIWLLLLNIIILPAWRIGIRLARKTGMVPFLGTLGKTMILKRTAIVGSAEEAKRITQKVLDRIEYGYSIEGFIDKRSPDSLLDSPTYLGNVADIAEIVSARKITDIIFSTESYSYEEVLDIIDKVKHNKMNFKIVPKQMDFIIGKSSVEPIEELSFIDIEFNIDKLFSLYILGNYKRRRFSATYAAWAVILGFLVNTTFTFFFKQFAYSREVLIWLLLLNIIILPAWRIGIRLARKTGMVPFLGTLGKTMILKRTAIVGSAEEAKRITQKVLDRIEYGYSIEGFIDKRSPDSLLDSPTYLGNVADIAEIVSARKITDIIFSTESYSYEEVLDIIDKVKHNKMNFKIVPKQMDFIIGKSSVESIEELSFIDIEFNIDKLFNRIIKRSADLVISTVLLILLLPFAIISFLFGRSFNGVDLLLQDKRVRRVYLLTKAGKIQSGILSSYPLLLHVLTGKMSIVGCELSLNPSDLEDIHCKPGLMSLAEIMAQGKRDEDERKKYEQYYLRNQSLRLDFEIIIKALFNL